MTSPVRRSAGRRAVGVLLMAVLALATTAAVQAVVAAVDLPAVSNVPRVAWTWTLVGGLVVLAGTVLLPRLPPGVRTALAVVTLTAVATAVAAWPLHGTAYYLGGLVSDQQFRTQYLTRLTDSASLADMNYADLPPFYPAGWFWLAGRVADLTGLAGWTAYKPVAVATVGLVPAISLGVWSQLLGRHAALAAATVTLVVGTSTVAAEPYSWPAAALLPAAAVLFAREVGRTPVRRLRVAAVGVFVGVAVDSYTLYGLFAGLLVVVLAALTVLAAPAAGGARRAVLRRSAGCVALVAGVAGVLALPVWAPFLLEVARSGLGGNLAAHFLPAGSAELPTPFGAGPWSWLGTLGLVALLARLCLPWGRRSDVYRALGVTALTAYAWYALSALALLAGTTLLPFRLLTVLTVVFAVAGVLAAGELLQAGTAWLRARGRPAARVPLAVAALAVLALAQAVEDQADGLEDAVSAAYTTPYPSGRTAAGTSDPGREEGWSDALAGSISRLTGRPPGDLVVLTTDYSLLSYQPYRGFQQITPHYANPLADYGARTDYAVGLAASTDAAGLLAALDAAPWRPPTVFVLDQRDDGLHLRLCRDAFPADPNVAFFDVVFDPEVFDPAEFSTEVVGPYLVAVRR